jgi:hypothetical protein
LYIESGSTINLTCVVYNSPEPPAYIFWNHNEAVSVRFPLTRSNFMHVESISFQIISYDSPRGGVSVVVEKGETTTSFLLIQNARPSDSGQYQCNPSNAKSRSVTVHVLNGNWFNSSLFRYYCGFVLRSFGETRKKNHEIQEILISKSISSHRNYTSVSNVFKIKNPLKSSS